MSRPDPHPGVIRKARMPWSAATSASARLRLALVLLLVAAASPTEAQETPLTIERLEQMALERHPALAQAGARVDAARGRARQAGMLPNPEVGYAGEEIPLQSDVRGGRHGVFIEQTVPLGGKLRLSREVFLQETRGAEASLSLERLALLNRVRTLAYSASAAARRVEVRERLSHIATEAVLITRQLYNVGAADQPDVLESETEAYLARVALENARNAQFRTWRALAAVIGTTELPLQPIALDLDAPLPELERDTARDRILRESPELRVLEAQIHREGAAVTRARREPFPDLFLRGAPLYNRELRDHAPIATGWEASVEVGVRVPLFNRNQGGIAAAAADASAAKLAFERRRLDLEARFAATFDEYLSALRQAEVLRSEVLPRAERAYALYQARHREMAAAYPQVLIAQRTLFQVTAQYVDAIETTWRTALLIDGLLVGEEGGRRMDRSSAPEGMEGRHD